MKIDPNFNRFQNGYKIILFYNFLKRLNEKTKFFIFLKNSIFGKLTTLTTLITLSKQAQAASTSLILPSTSVKIQVWTCQDMGDLAAEIQSNSIKVGKESSVCLNYLDR